MKQIVVLSGKGGTGKTTIAASLAHLASRQSRIVLGDADVDTANLELLLAPRQIEVHEFTGSKLAAIDQGRCLGCGACEPACRFGAIARNEGDSRIGQFAIDPHACEGCAACFYVCPAGAISMVERVSGRWYVSETRFGPLVHAHLFAGQENSGKLVSLVKQRVREIAHVEGRDYVIVDGPPGIGCQAIAACAGADVALLVAEPTVAGVHDLERMLATTNHFRVPALVVINKFDLNQSRAREIEDFCESRGILVVARIPFDTVVIGAMVHGRTVTEHAEGPVSVELARLWTTLSTQIEEVKTCT